MPKVSVIVPVYNVEAYLQKCLNSLVSQTLDDIEIVVVNDGSTDGSQNVIDEFQRLFPQKIKAFKKENGGLSDARNFGIERASGEFLGFVDSDDYVSHEMFEEMLGLAEKHDAEMVICNIQKVDEDGNVSQKLVQIPNMPEKMVLEDNLSLFSDLGYFACNKLIRKELFRDKKFKKGVHYEDIQLIPQLLLKCRIVAQTQKYHYNYLERRGSITKNHNLRGLDILNAVEDVTEEYHKSSFSHQKKYLKDFQILQGVYSFLAYLAYVKDKEIFAEMRGALKVFMQKNGISMVEILTYRRYAKNYLLSLPLRKKIYYLLYFSGQGELLRRLIK